VRQVHVSTIGVQVAGKQTAGNSVGVGETQPGEGNRKSVRAALNRVRGSVQVTEARFVTRVAALADEGRAPDPEDEQKRGARSSPGEAKRTAR
jgi:hypothetical protein